MLLDTLMSLLTKTSKFELDLLALPTFDPKSFVDLTPPSRVGELGGFSRFRTSSIKLCTDGLDLSFEEELRTKKLLPVLTPQV
jgi:hypothetical protein